LALGISQIPITSNVARNRHNRLGNPRNKSDQMNSKNLEGAIQSLVWAIEGIEKTGNKQAERHARLALEYLKKGKPSDDEQ
jgi:hypothetical protein